MPKQEWKYLNLNYRKTVRYFRKSWTKLQEFNREIFSEINHNFQSECRLMCACTEHTRQEYAWRSFTQKTVFRKAVGLPRIRMALIVFLHKAYSCRNTLRHQFFCYPLWKSEKNLVNFFSLLEFFVNFHFNTSKISFHIIGL